MLRKSLPAQQPFITSLLRPQRRHHVQATQLQRQDGALEPIKSLFHTQIQALRGEDTLS